MNVTTFRDPCYKQLPFLSEANRGEVIEVVKYELIGMYPLAIRPITQQHNVEESPVIVEPPAEKVKEGPMANLLGDVFSVDTDNMQPHLA